MRRLEGKVAIVTGGAIGIGRHYTGALAAEGARIAVVDIAGEGADLPEECRYWHTDVSDESAVETTVAEIAGWGGAIDILVNNAALFATLHDTKITDIDVATWDKVMAVNLRGPFLMMKHVVPHMQARKGGKIVNIGSGSANKGMPFMAHYVTSKAGMFGLTRTASRELGADNICVNTLSPGLILSDSISANIEHLRTNRDRVLKSRALARDGLPVDLIGALVFLCSGESDFISGQTIAVDGGSVNL